MKLASVLIIDDDAFIRTTLQAAISNHAIEVVGTVSNAADALECLKESKPEVAVVDLDLGPGPSGVDICYALREVNPQLGLILLTSYLDPRIHDKSSAQLPKGCRFISKSQLNDIKVLIQEIITVRNKPLASAVRITKAETGLTDTQLEVLKSVAEGLSTDEIAKMRGVSTKAIEAIIAKTHATLGIEKSKSINQRVQLARSYFTLSGKKPPGA